MLRDPGHSSGSLLSSRVGGGIHCHDSEGKNWNIFDSFNFTVKYFQVIRWMIIIVLGTYICLFMFENVPTSMVLCGLIAQVGTVNSNFIKLNIFISRLVTLHCCPVFPSSQCPVHPSYCQWWWCSSITTWHSHTSVRTTILSPRWCPTSLSACGSSPSPSSCPSPPMRTCCQPSMRPDLCSTTRMMLSAIISARNRKVNSKVPMLCI